MHMYTKPCAVAHCACNGAAFFCYPDTYPWVAKYEEGGGLNSWMAMVVGICVRSALDILVHMKPLRRSEAPPDALGVAKKILRTDYQQQRSPTTGGTRR